MTFNKEVPPRHVILFVCNDWWRFVLPILYLAKTWTEKKNSSTLLVTMASLLPVTPFLLRANSATPGWSTITSSHCHCWPAHFLTGVESHFFCSCQSNHLFPAHVSFFPLSLPSQPSPFSLPFNLLFILHQNLANSKPLPPSHSDTAAWAHLLVTSHCA